MGSNPGYLFKTFLLYTEMLPIFFEIKSYLTVQCPLLSILMLFQIWNWIFRDVGKGKSIKFMNLKWYSHSFENALMIASTILSLPIIRIGKYIFFCFFLKILLQNWHWQKWFFPEFGMAFWPEMAFGQNWLYGQKYFCQIWNGFLCKIVGTLWRLSSQF